MLPVIYTNFAAACAKTGDLLGIIPTWYKYVPLDAECGLDLDLVNRPSQFWLIGLGVVDILLRIAGLVAIGFIVYGGFLFITSQGESEGLKRAKNTIINALIGLTIAITASGLVSFIAGKF